MKEIQEEVSNDLQFPSNDQSVSRGKVSRLDEIGANITDVFEHPKLSEIELPNHEKFKFELKKGESKNKYAHKCVGRLVLALSVLGGSSIGVISNVL